MRLVLICFIIVLGWTRSASADIIFTLQQATPGPLLAGTNAIFELYVRSDGAPIVGNVGGMDAWVDANDPGNSGSETAGGHFVAGTDPYFSTVGGAYQLPFPTSLIVFSGTSPTALDLPTTNTLLASLTLSTVGAIDGNYTMGLNNLVAIDLLGHDLGVSNLSTTSISYSIVPEPTSLGLGIVALAGAAWRRRSKRST